MSDAWVKLGVCPEGSGSEAEVQVQAQVQLTRVKSQFATDLPCILGCLTSVCLTSVTPSASWV